MANYSISQHNATTTGGGTLSSTTCVYTSSQTAGNINIITIGFDDNTHTVTGVSDTKNGSYTLAVSTVNSTSTGYTQAIYYFPGIIAATSSSNTVTVTFSGAADTPDLRIFEFTSTNGTVWVLDKSVGAATSGTSPSSGNTASTTHANDLVIGSCGTYLGISAFGAGYTGISITSPNADADEWKEVAVTGVQAATFTDGASTVSVTQCAAFNASGAGATWNSTTYVWNDTVATWDSLGVGAYPSFSANPSVLYP